MLSQKKLNQTHLNLEQHMAKIENQVD